jgi:putative flavoprotein involved in K+ transport
MRNESPTEQVNTVVIGGGQAGLSVGYHLSRRDIPFVILDANEHIGDQWRHRWDSLRLFTPAQFSGLDGMRFPAPPHYFPTKDEMADFLERYAQTFKLPVLSGTRVERVSRHGDTFLVETGTRQFEARNVLVAMANFQRPRVPPFAKDLHPDIIQVHSFDYRNPSQLRDGDVLVVGAGNSGAEIALEAARTHKTWLSGRDVGHVPFDINGLFARLLLFRVALRVLFHRVLTVATPLGRAVRPKVLHIGAPLVRTKPRELDAAGVQRVPRVARVHNGLPVLDDGRVLEVKNVVWCTGFDPGFTWLELPVFAPNGDPVHERGIVTSEPGLYFVGLHFLYAFSSTMIHGVGRDAERIASHIAARAGTVADQRAVASSAA